MKKGQLSGLFVSFAARECRGSSELYEHLALHIAEDDCAARVSLTCEAGAAGTKSALRGGTLLADKRL